MEKKVAKDLLNIVYKVQEGSERATEESLDIFQPLFGKYSSRLRNEDIKQELSLFLLEQLKNYPASTFQSDGAFVQYIARSVYHEYIRFSKRQKERISILQPLNGEMTYVSHSNMEEQLDINDLLHHLSQYQRNILILKYYYGYAEQEIGDKLHVSKQAVNKQKHQALHTLKLNLIN